MKKLIILIECLIIASPIIAWRIGVLSLARLGDIMIAFGGLGVAIIVLAILNLRVPLGDVSRYLSMNEIDGIDRADGKLSTVFVLQVLVLVILPLTIGVLIQLFS